ncbi:MAG TPA: sulfatase [Pirellulales bacterium]|nr:sulfatase [Pirellulales bacterium]
MFVRQQAGRPHHHNLLGHLLHEIATLIIVTANLTHGICQVSAADLAEKPCRPNIVLILADDLGYGDLGCYGHPTIATPNLDRMAAEGMKFTQFYVASSVCTPSRAALLTGRYAIRSGMTQVLIPKSSGGLPGSEVTLASALRTAGYATACIGKWHLGRQRQFLPLSHGFDYFFGLAYANDMSPWAQPNNPTFNGDPPHPLIRNFEVTNTTEPDQSQLTRQYTEESIRFIRETTSKKRPFFLYLSHTFPHLPLFASEKFRGKSRRGIYGDTVEELDWSCGEVLKALQAAGVDRQTLVMFTSDNGPWVGRKLEGGSPGLFTEGKVTTWEGGFRVPAIFRWPGTIPAGVTSEAFATAMDLFTTFIKLGGGHVPTDRVIDGADISPVLTSGEAGREPLLFYYFGEEVWAARKGPWKIHRKSITPGTTAKWGAWTVVEHHPPLLFNVEQDPSEHFDIAAEHPETVRELSDLMDAHAAEMKPGPLQR